MADNSSRPQIFHTTTPEGVPPGWGYDMRRQLWSSPDGTEWIADERLPWNKKPQRVARPGTSIRLVLEVSPLDFEGELDPELVYRRVSELVRELEEVKKQDGDVTLTVNGFGMDFWLRDARAERVTQ